MDIPEIPNNQQPESLNSVTTPEQRFTTAVQEYRKASDQVGHSEEFQAKLEATFDKEDILGRSFYRMHEQCKEIEMGDLPFTTKDGFKYIKNALGGLWMKEQSQNQLDKKPYIDPFKPTFPLSPEELAEVYSAVVPYEIEIGRRLENKADYSSRLSVSYLINRIREDTVKKYGIFKEFSGEEKYNEVKQDFEIGVDLAANAWRVASTNA